MPIVELMISTAVAAAGAPVAAPQAQAPVTRAGAARIARAFVERRFGQPARVTGAEREDDFGARWEIEVTRRDGAEFDVYVAAGGKVVRVIRNRATGPAPTPAPAAGTPVTAARASAVALRFVERRFGQPARVTGAEREDDHGARWEIEVTRGDGAEFDVYVTARGAVVRIVRTPAGG